MKLALLGDIALIGIFSVYRNTSMIRNGWGEVMTVISDHDYVVGNLESPFSFSRIKHGAKSAFLCTEPENVELLKMLHVNAVTIANNHMFDYGREGYELTKKILDEASIEWFGAEGNDLKVEIDGNKLAFTGWCCYSTNPQGCVCYGEYGLNELDVSVVERRLREYSNEGWLNIAAIHTGIEHVNYPSLDTICLANRLAKTGPMIYYGHHPHVVQPVIMSGESLIAYSLGNFCFDDIYAKSTDKDPLVKMSAANRSSFILSVTIEKNKIIEYEIIPIFISNTGIEVGHGATKELLDGYLNSMNSMSSENYATMRHEQRMEWVRPRMAKRDLAWVLKRLRPMYVKLMLTNKRNAKNYIKHVVNQL